MNLHILQGHAFARSAIQLFEKYAPKDNWYVFPDNRNSIERVNELDGNPEVWGNLLTSREQQRLLLKRIQSTGVDKVFVHMLTKQKAGLVSWLKKNSSVTIYWVFFGADLYTHLAERGKYELYDEPESRWKRRSSLWLGELKSLLRFGQTRSAILRQGIADVDYFCFWNEYDYQLLRRHYKTKAQHLDFLFYGLIARHLTPLSVRSKDLLLLNHSASSSGNHLSMLRQLKAVDQANQLRLLMPLSYGDGEVKEAATQLGSQLFGDRLETLTAYLPQDEYYAKLNGCTVAVFGNRRQEAAGNVFYLLSGGVKVFLRNDNTMLNWLRQRGFLVFSVEEDLVTYADLSSLTPEAAEVNRSCYLRTFAPEQEQKMMNRLLR